MCLLLAGCGSAGSIAPTATPHKVARVAPTATSLPEVIPTPTAGSVATATPTPGTPTPGVSPTPTGTTVPVVPTSRPRPEAPAAVISAALRPRSAAPGASLTATVQTSGRVRRVDVYLGSGSPAGPAPETFTLAALGSGTWTGTGQAPAKPGQYHYTVGLYTGAGRKIVDSDSWNITVTGAASSPPASLTLPDNIPLAPPFSYGNPAPAVFNWAGSSVNGAEVVSTRRPDVAPTVVAQWYETHLARAGWSVDQSSLPGAGATSFSISASTGGASGEQVCIVQYSDYTVHIFYGTLTG